MRRPLWTRQLGFRANPTIVLIPGAFQNSASWPTAFLHRLVDLNFHVVTMDLRDFGKNAREHSPFTLQDMTDDVLYTMTAHRIRKAHVLGASMGGAIALRMTLSDPERCLTATFLASTPGRLWQDPELRPSSRKAMAAMRTEHALAQSGHVTRALNVRTRAFGDDQRQHNAIIRQGYNPDSKQGEACMTASGLLDRLGDIRVPSLVVHGSSDEMYPVEHAWRMHHGIRASKLIILPGINHRFPTEWSVPLADAIADHATHQRLPTWHKKKPDDQATDGTTGSTDAKEA